jgi:DNA polymerase
MSGQFDQLKEHLEFASELGVEGISSDPVWRRRPEPSAVVASESAAATVESGAATSVNGLDVESTMESPGQPVTLARDASELLARIKSDVGPDCSRCKLHRLGRTQVVFGVGNPDARLMFVGEAPGADEDAQGIPFVGRAGQLLTKIIESIGLTRDEVYIANVIKCRPPQNRNPEPDEVERCEPFLFRQIDAIQPEVIVALGKFAVQTLLRTLDPISRLRGRVFDFRGARLVPTFHPAYLLRNPASKREVWEDMKLVRRLLAQA